MPSRDPIKRAEAAKRSYEKNREQRLEKSRAHYAATLEAQHARGAAYREKNKEVVLAKLRAYKVANPEKVKAQRSRSREYVAAQCKAWRAANPDRQATNHNTTQNARRASKLHATPEWLTDAHHAQIKAWYEFGRSIGYDVDHIVPLKAVDENGVHVASGLHVPWNLQTLHPSENRSKGNRLMYQSPVGGP